MLISCPYCEFEITISTPKVGCSTLVCPRCTQICVLKTPEDLNPERTTVRAIRPSEPSPVQVPIEELVASVRQKLPVTRQKVVRRKKPKPPAPVAQQAAQPAAPPKL